jgi:ABC-2 type transport system permease protein
MISCTSIWAIVLRHMRVWRRDINALLFHIYWPILDILMWGYLGMWIQRSSQATPFHNYEIVALLGIVLWQFVGRGANIILASFTEELWSGNLVNLFSLPLRRTEWICGVIIFYTIMMMFALSMALITIALFYDVSISEILLNLLIFSPPLFLCGIWVGFTALQIISIFGKRGVEMGFVTVWLFLPFSGAYYPTDILPHWGQVISSFLPMNYVFQGMRAYVIYQQDPTLYLVKGYALGVLYAALGIVGFIYCFNRSKIKGLARLTD